MKSSKRAGRAFYGAIANRYQTPGGIILKKLGIISLILLGIVAASLALNGCGGKAKGPDGTVIAEYDWNGKQHVTLEEMMQEISELPQYKQDQYKDKEGLEEYMTLMAESRLILCFAKDQKIDQEPEILKKVQNYLHELMVDKVTTIEVDNKLKVTEEDFRLYYEENKSDYVQDEQVRLTCITLADEERAKEALASIQEGKDIAELAKELSDRGELTGPGANPSNPGDTGLFSRNNYPQDAKAFVDAAFETEVGQTFDNYIPVEVQGQKYFMLFRKEEHNEARQKAFDEEDVQRDVENSVERAKRDTLMDDWLAQLRDKAKVKTYLERIPETPKPEEEASEGQ
jgi:hypothetical protein